MFKNLASDALGLSDIGKIIPPSQFNQTDIDDYIFQHIIKKYQSYCPILPVAPQGNDMSNISNGMYSMIIGWTKTKLNMK